MLSYSYDLDQIPFADVLQTKYVLAAPTTLYEVICARGLEQAPSILDNVFLPVWVACRFVL